MTTSTEQQERAVRNIVDGLHKLTAWKNYLGWDFRLKLSEALRDVADEIDRGIAERAHRKHTPTLKRLRHQYRLRKPVLSSRRPSLSDWPEAYRAAQRRGHVGPTATRQNDREICSAGGLTVPRRRDRPPVLGFSGPAAGR